MADLTGEADRSALRLDFDRRLMLQFRGSTITSDSGLLPYRELDETLMLAEGAELWGRFDEATGKVTMGGEAAAAGQDLLDGVAARVLRHGGAITILSPAEMPDAAPAAAVLRF
jgi:hypothetical protein